jgi:hypothetical protein
MGIAPSEFRAMTPSEMFEVKESWVEAQGGISQRQRRKARADFERLKRLYPDTPVEGNA